VDVAGADRARRRPSDQRTPLGLCLPAVAFLLLALPLAQGGATATAVPRETGSSQTAWAYGGTLEYTGTPTVGNISLGYSDTSDYAVVLSQTVPNASTIQLAVSRLITTRAFLIACYPDCASPQYAMTASGTGLEFETAELELTPNATVALANGSSTSALGLASEQLTLSGNLTVRFSWENYSAAGPAREEWFNATTVANTTGLFTATQALGLVPSAYTPGESWNGSGSFIANATTAFSGASSYQGGLIPSNHSSFNGTAVPRTPMLASVEGTDLGAPSDEVIAQDAAMSLTPSSGGTSLLEGAILVPTSAYLSAAFSSSCDLAQRACTGIGATPQLDLNASQGGHLGWDAAVSSVSAFSLWLDSSAVRDTPDGAAFWPTAAGDQARELTPSLPVPATVTGLPISVQSAESLQRAFHPPNPNGTLPSNSTSPPAPPARPPTLPGPRAAGGIPPAAPALPIASSVTNVAPVGLLLGTVAIAVGVSATAAALAARRRRPPRRKALDTLDPPPVEPLPDGTDGAEDPMGYVW
jgi:hypothetical protein